MNAPDDLLNAVILAREDPTDRLLILHIRPDAGRVADFEPGQFVQIGLPHAEAPEPGARIRVHKRSYSIASSPHVPESVELCIARVEGGRFTPALWNLRAGDRVWMDPVPRGFFVLGRVSAEKELVFVATGTGIAPYVSMLRRWGPGERWRRATIVHGVRLPEELVYRAELEARARRDASFVYLPAVSRAPAGSNWSGLSGRVQFALEPDRFRELTGRALDPAHCHVFLCGNPDMIRDVRAELEPRGFKTDTVREPGTLHFEKYW